MTSRLLPLIALCLLSGCASNLYWGPALPTCSGFGTAAKFGSGACRNGAEYAAARKKAKQSLAEDAARSD